MGKERIQIGHIPAVIYGKKSDKLCLYVHGRQSCKEEAEKLAPLLEPYGYQILSFDLPEHGERKDGKTEFSVQNCVYDLQFLWNSIMENYDTISLYACSIGAYFSLVAYKKIHFDKCLIVSPILDMERLILNMMKWAGVTHEKLQAEKEIKTSFGETLSWEYYQYVINHPVHIWDSKTFKLYGRNDRLTEKSVLDIFREKHDCSVRIMEKGEHYFHTREQMQFLTEWVEDVMQYSI